MVPMTSQAQRRLEGREQLGPVHTTNWFVPLSSKSRFQTFSCIHTGIVLNPLHITCVCQIINLSHVLVIYINNKTTEMCHALFTSVYYHTGSTWGLTFKWLHTEPVRMKPISMWMCATCSRESQNWFKWAAWSSLISKESERLKIALRF